MHEYYRPYTSSTTTIDWAESFHANEHLDIIADLNTAPIPGVADESFDSIIMSDVLEHIYTPRVLLEELHRIMRPGASLMMNVPFCYWIHEAPHDYHRYTEFALKRYLEDAGFDVVVIKPLGGIIACAIDMLSKGAGMIDIKRGGVGKFAKMLVRLPFWLTMVAVQNTVCLLRNVPLFHSFLQAKKTVFPLMYFIVARKCDDDPGKTR